MPYPAGSTTYDTGPADPYYRFRQLERLQGVAELLAKQAEERRDRERKRLDNRIALAASAVAAGGDVASPAVQGVLSELRDTAATKKWAKHEGYDKVADLLELNFKTKSENDPELIQQRSMQAVREAMAQEAQRYAATSGTGPGDMASQPQPPLGQLLQTGLDTAHGSGPVGLDAMVGMFGQTNAARMLSPEAFGHFPKTGEATQDEPASLRERQQLLLDAESDDPTVRDSARYRLGLAPRPRAPGQAGGAGRTSTAATPQERQSTDQLKAIRDELETKYKDRITAWEQDVAGQKPSTGYTATQMAERMAKRPKMPANIDSLARKVQEVRNTAPEQADAVQMMLEQALEEGELERAWLSIKRQMKAARGGD